MLQNYIEQKKINNKKKWRIPSYGLNTPMHALDLNYFPNRPKSIPNIA